MSFDLLDRPLVWVPVRWPGLKPGPDDAIGVPVEHEIEALVELLDIEEIQASVDDQSLVTNADKAKAFLRGWRKVVAKGVPVPFDDANLAKMFAVPGFRQGLETAYLRALVGKVETREGNSAGSPVDGRAESPAPVATDGAKPNATAPASA
jgi:hypothetical protein